MARAGITKSCLLGRVILLISANAFTIHKNPTIRTLRASTLCHKSLCTKIPTPLQAVPSQVDNELPDAMTPTLSKYDDRDPRQALEQFGSLFSQVQAIATEGGTWDSDTLEIKTQEFVRTYLRIFVPGIGYAVTSLAVFASAFAFFALALTLSGRGYSDILAAVSAIGPLRSLLEKADPAGGNAASALVGCEVLSPAILAATLALTPRTMEALRGKLDEMGWGEDDIEKRAADILRLTG